MAAQEACVLHRPAFPESASDPELPLTEHKVHVWSVERDSGQGFTLAESGRLNSIKCRLFIQLKVAPFDVPLLRRL